ncbi:hypothetical protein CBG25_00260 [Arsenophonus sp. ENCA]|uniref:hypothetical protein n=1 Tax=Arsenophonus sp. ENCA TaxID=1987579 RepID=UPI000BD70EFD|nr:hypothetical protein [Arsenophonus sp. ENCA]PAV11590.1 hypothetical protein CBG25_00260 [Arsenophonus sp. ENCA]
MHDLVEVEALGGKFQYWFKPGKVGWKPVENPLAVTVGQFIKGKQYHLSHPDESRYGRDITLPVDATLRFTVKVNETIWHPKVVWTQNCAVDKANAVKAKAGCSQNGEARYVVKDGKRYPVTLPCWQESEE